MSDEHPHLYVPQLNRVQGMKRRQLLSHVKFVEREGNKICKGYIYIVFQASCYEGSYILLTSSASPRCHPAKTAVTRSYCPVP